MVGPSPSALAERRRDLARLADETFDLVIVGGGIVGCGALLDATTRGMRAALIEQGDVAIGTSSRSSRLIHGGLRYLEQLHVPLVRESLAERHRLLRLAPHLVRLEPLLFPIFGIPYLSKAFYDAGLTLYDVLGARQDGGWHDRLDVAETLAIAPALRREGLRGGLRYHDGMEDDARFTLAVLRTALASAAAPVALTRVRATGIERVTSSDGLTTLSARDELGGQDLEIRTTRVVDATGAWAAERDHPFANAALTVRPSRGAHIVVPRARIPSTAGLAIRVPGKVVFLVPWPEHWLIGTTDASYEGSPVRPTADGWEIDELLATVNQAMDVDLTRADITGTYAGLRPLVAGSSGSTVKASREHRVSVGSDGVVRIAGGKYTTYRLMARDVVDAVLGKVAAKARPSATADHVLVGAADHPTLARLSAEIAPTLGAEVTHPDAASRLVERHGTEATAVVRLGSSLDLLRPLIEGRPFLEAEVAWAVDHERALSIDDVLARRLRLAVELRDRGAAIAPRVAAIMGSRLDWDTARQAREVETYLASATREYAVAPSPSDNA
jgi:glycerol-3-phosphate dehydrogenase